MPKFDPSKLEELERGTWAAILDYEGQKTIDELWGNVVDRVTLLNGKGLRHKDIADEIVGDVFDSGLLTRISPEHRDMRVILVRAMVCQAIDGICL